MSVISARTVGAQETIWASKILGFSSEYRPEPYGKRYRASQILGAPEKLPDTGDSPCAWTTAIPDGTTEEWIKVGFEKPLLAKQVLIGENHNPGALIRVLGYDETGEEFVISQDAELRGRGDYGRLLHLSIPSAIVRPLVAVKLIMKPSLVGGYNQIDAVGLTSSTQPVKLEIAVASDIPKTVRKTNLGTGINTIYKEVAPVVSPDESTLYFTRSDFPGNKGDARKQDVWFSKRDVSGRWGASQNMGAPINNESDNAVLGISADGKTLYLLNQYNRDGSMSQGFSKSKWQDGKWTFPEPLIINDHYNEASNNHVEMAIAPDERTLVISVQRKDSFGSRDLYVSFLESSGRWSTPKNMGAVLNTPDYEGTPYIAPDNKTLYFTSRGHRGYGNGDIFVARRLDDTWLSWSKPLNLGPSINSKRWDGYFTIPATGEYAYMSSGELINQSDDIYKVELYPSIQPEMQHILLLTLTDASTSKPLVGTIQFRDVKRDSVLVTSSYSPENGPVEQLVPVLADWVVEAKVPGYWPLLVRGNTLVDYQVKGRFSKVLELHPLVKGLKAQLSTLQFKQSSAEFDLISNGELMAIAKVLKENPQMKILLEGHTDNQGDSQKNLQLSGQRALAIKQFLMNEGVTADRIETKAWGSTRPLTNNLTEENRSKNRRVELTISSL